LTLAPAPGHAVGQLTAQSVLQLQQDIDATLAQPLLERATWGIVVRSLARGETLYSINPHRLLMPASNMKIVTLAAAAERLGWDHTFTTTLSIAGRVANGTLDGDLIVTGSGDPSLGLEDGSAARAFGAWANELKQLGVRVVTGRVIGDDNAFEDQTLGFGWSWDDLPDDYAAGIGALQFNENRVTITITPSHTEGALAGLSVSPEGSGMIVDCRVTTGAAGTPEDVKTSRYPGAAHLVVSGSVPLGGPAVTTSAAVDNPTQYYVTELRRALIAHGIDVDGRAVDVSEAPDTQQPNGRALLDLTSPPLQELAVRLMKSSQNQYAETLLKTLGVRGGFGTWDAGRTIAKTTLLRWGIGPSEIIIADGSGLSRYGFVTAGALARILAHVYADATLRDRFVASLPIAGRDGTLAGRMKGTKAEGNARAKTGSMSNVRRPIFQIIG